MKRFLSLILMLSIVLSMTLFGCGNIASDGSTESESISASEEISSKEDSEIIAGQLSALDAVYSSELITKQDLLSIAYHNGDIAQNQDLIGNEYEPKEIQDLEPAIEKSIKYALAMSFSSYYQSGESYYGEKIAGFKYLGEYNGYYAVIYAKESWELEAVKKDYVIGGVRFVETSVISPVKMWKRQDYTGEKVQAQKQAVKVIIDSYEQEIKIENGEVFTKNDMPMFHKDYIEGIYVDAEGLTEYGKTPITQDVTLYLKLKKTVEFSLTKDTCNQIMADVKKDTTNKNAVITYYLGKYKDYQLIEVYLQQNDTVEGAVVKQIEGEDFTLRWMASLYPIYAWKDGEVISLTTLFEREELDSSDWEAIVEGHYEMYPEMKI